MLILCADRSTSSKYLRFLLNRVTVLAVLFSLDRMKYSSSPGNTSCHLCGSLSRVFNFPPKQNLRSKDHLEREASSGERLAGDLTCRDCGSCAFLHIRPPRLCQAGNPVKFLPRLTKWSSEGFHSSGRSPALLKHVRKPFFYP